MGRLSFRVSIPTDEGFVGRECSGADCGRYFRIHAESVQSELHCPYCGRSAPSDAFFTNDQVDHISRAAGEQALEHISGELDKMFKRMASRSSGNRHVSIKYTSRPYHAKAVTPRYRERRVDSELVCPSCSARFQVDGIFAYCVRCATANTAIYDANLTIIRAEIASATEPQRALRHAYNDLVATFEAVCACRAKSVTSERGHFQDPYDARRFFDEHAEIDILAGLGVEQLLVVRRLFQKRHAYQHTQGRITERYIEKIPEDRRLLGTIAELSLDELESGAHAIGRMVDTLVRNVARAT